MHQHHQHLHVAQRDVGQHAPSMATSPGGRGLCASRNHLPACYTPLLRHTLLCTAAHNVVRHHLVEVGCAADRAACVLHTAATTLIVVRCCCQCHSISCSGFPSTIMSLGLHCDSVELRPFCMAPTMAAHTRLKCCSSTPPSDQGRPSVSTLPPSCSPRSGGEETAAPLFAFPQPLFVQTKRMLSAMDG